MAELTARSVHLQELNRLREAIKKTKSKYLIRDYKKAIKRKERELIEFDRWTHEKRKLEKENN